MSYRATQMAEAIRCGLDAADGDIQTIVILCRLPGDCAAPLSVTLPVWRGDLECKREWNAEAIATSLVEAFGVEAVFVQLVGFKPDEDDG